MYDIWSVELVARVASFRKPPHMGGLRTTLWGLLPDPARAYNELSRYRLDLRSGCHSYGWRVDMHIPLVIAVLALLVFALLPQLARYTSTETGAHGLRIIPRPFGTLDQFMSAPFIALMAWIYYASVLFLVGAEIVRVKWRSGTAAGRGSRVNFTKWRPTGAGSHPPPQHLDLDGSGEYEDTGGGQHTLQCFGHSEPSNSGM